MSKIKDKIKKSRFLYSLYYYIMSFFVNVIKLFVSTDKHLILFVCYGGRHYSDSPRVIYESMCKDERFKDYKLVWAFTDPEKYDIPNKIQIDSFKYYKTALKARCWITNVMVERALNFTGKKTFYFFTTHGILCKLGGKDLRQGSSFDTKAELKYDYSIAQSEYEKKISMRQFGFSENQVGVLGMPKNDILANHTVELRDEIKNKLRIPQNKKVILYAPTFREWTGNMAESFDIDVDKWKESLGEDYVLLYRAHPVVAASRKENDGFFIDTTNYDKVEDLMIASDILVSDYSGIIFDYCVMRKPIFLFTYDYEDYERTRGLYFDIRKELPYAMTEASLLDMIKNSDYSQVYKEVQHFQEKFATVYGNATENCIDVIYKNIV